MMTLNWPWWLILVILGVENWPVATGRFTLNSDGSLDRFYFECGGPGLSDSCLSLVRR